jgi:threonine/homoserine/homoserine lactone efflux protein
MVNITEVARRGFWAGPAVALGHSLLELVTVALLAAGLSPFLERTAGVVGLLGGAFLLWIGFKMVRAAPGLSLTAQLAAVRPGLSAGPIVAGVTASISNPYWLVWWATVGAGFTVTALALGTAGIGAFYLGHISADFAWYIFIAGLVATGRRSTAPCWSPAPFSSSRSAPSSFSPAWPPFSVSPSSNRRRSDRVADTLHSAAAAVRTP